MSHTNKNNAKKIAIVVAETVGGGWFEGRELPTQGILLSGRWLPYPNQIFFPGFRVLGLEFPEACFWLPNQTA